MQYRRDDHVRFRMGLAADRPFIEKMTLVAVNWTGRTRRQDPGTSPELARYHEGWPRNAFGVLALVESGAPGAETYTPVGAAWAVHLTSDGPGYGYVDDALPEILLAVEEEHRGHGIGGRLMDGLFEKCRDRGVKAVSVAVEHGNYVRELFDHLGFRVERTDGDTDVLVGVVPAE